MKIFQLCVFFVFYWEISSLNVFSENSDCPPTMIAYLVNENSTEEFCDCKETDLYYPEDDSCYDAYRQGPCPLEHYLALTPGETVAKCVKNPCHVDGFVPYQGKCQILWAGGKPCNDEFIHLGVNEDNYEIECVQSGYLGNLDDLKTSKSCPRDSYLTSSSEDNTHYSCECKATFLYSTKNDSCHEAYRQGPCPLGQYFILPPGKNEPQCEKNPCQEDGLVPFSGGCHEINTIGPPCSDETQLTIDKNTFQLQCSDVYFKVFGVGGIITAPRKACPLGSRRIITRCKRVFQ